MRHHVPFLGERRVVRADDESARTKRMNGRVIDYVIGDGNIESSWEDVVPAGWNDQPKIVPADSIGPHVVVPAPRALVKTKSQVPIKKSAAKENVASPQKNTASNKLTSAAAARLNWVSINNGRGLRVIVRGNIDYDLRKEWRRLLEDTETASIKEYEFNLNETPTLSLIGLGMLLLFKERKGVARGAIKLCNCNKDVTQLLHWTGMDKYFLIENTQISDVK